MAITLKYLTVIKAFLLSYQAISAYHENVKVFSKMYTVSIPRGIHLETNFSPLKCDSNTLHNVCAVHWGACSIPGIFSTLGGYHEYTGGYYDKCWGRSLENNTAFWSYLILVSNPLLLLSKEAIWGKIYPN